jgi:hypothetical protein
MTKKILVSPAVLTPATSAAHRAYFTAVNACSNPGATLGRVQEQCWQQGVFRSDQAEGRTLKRDGIRLGRHRA